MNNLIVICGPTAVGKTDLAFSIAPEINGELISADSRQIYIGMDIGTGKDIPEGEHIWLTDIIEPTKSFGSGLFQRYANEAIEKIHEAKKTPIVVGGTGFYINSLIKPSEYQHIPPNENLRQKLNQKSVAELQNILQKIDNPRWQAMNHSDQNNPHRLIRAIETTSAPKNISPFPEYRTHTVGLIASPEFLIQKITTRVQKRLESGFAKEVQGLMKQYPNFPDTPGGKTMGYAEMVQYLKGSLTEDVMIAQWKKREIDYMKRQITWFKKQPNIVWFDITDKNWYAEAVNQLKKWM